MTEVSIASIRTNRSNQILNSVRGDTDRLRKAGRLDRAWLIGSFANGQWDATSDIDLIIIGRDKISYKDFAVGATREMDVILISQLDYDRRMHDPLFAETIRKGIEL